MHYLVISSICNRKHIPVLFVEAQGRFKSDGIAVNGFVKFDIITLQYSKGFENQVYLCSVKSCKERRFVLWNRSFSEVCIEE